MKKITVLLVDDHALVRQGLRALLNQEQDMEIVGEAQNGVEALKIATRMKPDVILMDVVMPVMNGLQATIQVLKEVPATRVLVLSHYNDDDYVQQLTSAGAYGYLLKYSSAEDIALAIREVNKGNAFFSPIIAKRLRDRCRQAFADGEPLQKKIALPPRESTVLRLLAEGASNRQIATKLKVALKEVERVRRRVQNKLNIHDIPGLTRYAVSKGLVSCDFQPIRRRRKTNPNR